MKKIIIPLKSLTEKLCEMERGNVRLVELQLIPEQEDCGNQYPAFLHLEGILENGACRDYEGIDEIAGPECARVHKSA